MKMTAAPDRPPAVSVDKGGLRFRPGDSTILVFRLFAFPCLVLREAAFYFIQSPPSPARLRRQIFRRLAFLCLVLKEVTYYVLYVTRQLVDLLLSVPAELLQPPAPAGLPAPPSQLALTAGRLAQRIRGGQITSQEVVSACVSRLRQLDPQLKCVAEERFTAALTEARAADAELIRLRTEVGRTDGARLEYLLAHRPLLGVPFTVQETVAARGMRLRRGEVASGDAQPVAALRAAGAVLLATTRAAEPQSWWDDATEVSLPHDARRVAGDGGAALVAAEGTPIALGVGGTLLASAAYCGVFAHIASPKVATLTPAELSPDDDVDITRTLKKSITTNNLKQLQEDSTNSTIYTSKLQIDLTSSTDAEVETCRPPVGIITRDVDDLRTTLHLLSRSAVAQGTLRELVPVSHLRVFTVELPALLVTTAARREVRAALHRAGDTLRRQGAIVRAAEIPEVASLFDIVRSGLADAAGGGTNMPPPARLLCLLNDVSSLSSTGGERAAQLANQLRRRLSSLLGSDGVLVMPAWPTPAPLRPQRHLRPLDGVASHLSAALRLPGCVVPCGESSTGLPLGVQILAAPGADRLCLAAAEGLRSACVLPRWADARRSNGKGLLETHL